MKTILKNNLQANRQKQMLLLIERYKRVVKMDYGTWILPYSWNIGYIELQDGTQEIKYQEFFCNTNNLVFAAMIFEAQMLPVKITIAYIEFNSLVTT